MGETFSKLNGQRFPSWEDGRLSEEVADSSAERRSQFDKRLTNRSVNNDSQMISTHVLIQLSTSRTIQTCRQGPDNLVPETPQFLTSVSSLRSAHLVVDIVFAGCSPPSRTIPISYQSFRCGLDHCNSMLATQRPIIFTTKPSRGDDAIRQLPGLWHVCRQSDYHRISSAWHSVAEYCDRWSYTARGTG